MDLHNYPELLYALKEQLPCQLRRKLRVSVSPNFYGQLPTAIYYSLERQWEFTIQEDGLISNLDIARLCLEV
jgi:hypothetical protein